MFKSHHISRISAGLAMIRIRFRIQGNLTRLGRERKLKIDFVHKKKKKNNNNPQVLDHIHISGSTKTRKHT
jgi:hypothetical protein